MTGRKPKPTAIKELEGSPGKRKLNNKEPKPDKGMHSFLHQAVILLFLIVLLGFFNEKVTKFTYEISLMLYAIVIGVGVLILISMMKDTPVRAVLENLQVFNLEAFLMEGVLCFMLFAGSCHMRLLNFKKHARPITLLSIVATLLGAIFYGVLFNAGASLLGLPFTFPVCLILGSITAPTDPIAATEDGKRRIFVSLLAVSMAYALCEYFGFSGAIASVVCGILFSSLRNYREKKGKPLDLQEYDTFWEILDNLLNSILYVMMGLTFVHILQMQQVHLISCLAVLFNLIGRFSSVGISTLFAGKLPNGYDKLSFMKLLTYGGMRGGLSIALAMSTVGMVSAETYHIILGSTYVIVFFTTVVQGMTMKYVYQKIDKKISTL